MNLMRTFNRETFSRQTSFSDVSTSFRVFSRLSCCGQEAVFNLHMTETPLLAFNYFYCEC